MKGRYVVILGALLFLLPLTPVFGEGLFDEGMTQFKEENYEEALQYFLEARTLDPTSTKAAFFTGLTYKHMEDYKSAIPHLRDAVTMSPPIKEALIELIDALNQTDDIAEAKKWVDVGEKEGIQPGRIQFFKGTILLKEKKYAEAISAFEKAKETDPSLNQAAEFQIANAYIQMGKWKDARTRLGLANRIDPNTDIGTYARDYEKLVTDKMEQERPWRFALSLGYKYDTNLVAAPTTATAAGIPLGSDLISKKKDFALNTTARISYTAPFSFRNPYNLSVQYALYADRYFRRDDFNTMTNSITVTPGYNFTKFSLSMPLSYTYSNLQREWGGDFLNGPNWYKDTWYLEQFGVNPTLRFMTSQNSIGEVSVSYIRKRVNNYIIPNPVTEERFNSTPDEDRDAVLYGGSLGWTYFFKKGAGLLSLRYTIAQERTDGHNWSNDDQRFSAILLFPLIDRLKLQSSGEAAFTKYVHENSLFGVQRRDDIYNASIGLVYDLTKNMNLLGQYTYIRDKSNIDLYDYTREIFMLSVEYRY